MDVEIVVQKQRSSHCQFGNKYLHSYIIDKPVGKGRLATVWSANLLDKTSQTSNTLHSGGSEETTAAIKVFRCEKDNYENIKYYTNEVKILQKIFKNNHPPHIVRYFGTFAHIEMIDDKPWIHPCIAFELLGDSLSKLIKYCILTYKSGLPMNIVKKLMIELLTAIQYIHNLGIIHTDIKPSNILLSDVVSESLADDVHIKLADFGTSTINGEMFSSAPGTTGYIAPELVIDADYSYPIDIWSAFTVCFEMITGNLLFDVYDECKVQYGEDVDGEALEGLVDETENKMEYSQSSGDEENVEDEKIHYRYLLLIAKVIGYPSKDFTARARKYYNRKDKLMYNPDVEPISIKDLLLTNCSQMEENLATNIEEFLLQGLKYNPDERITAQNALRHNFLNVFCDNAQ